MSQTGFPPDYSFVDRPAYFESLTKDVARTVAGDRVAVSAMSLDAREPLVHDLMDELAAAALRHVEVIVAIDAFTFLKNDDTGLPGPLWYPGAFPRATMQAPFKAAYEALEKIREAGGTYCITNQPSRPFTIPHVGRSHIKEAVVNNVVRLGGHNLEAPHELDIMAVFEHAELADYIFNLIGRIATAGNVRRALSGRDQHFRTSDGLDLFVDAGVPGQSRILDEALAFIDSSEEWIFLTCQYFPGGRLGEHLRRARDERHVSVQSVFSHPRVHGSERILHYLYLMAQRVRRPAVEFEYQMPKDAPKLHAKLLANEKGAMLGSHNYVNQGVQLGTAEIAMRIMDPAFSLAAVAAIAELLPFDIGLPAGSGNSARR